MGIRLLAIDEHAVPSCQLVPLVLVFQFTRARIDAEKQVRGQMGARGSVRLFGLQKTDFL